MRYSFVQFGYSLSNSTKDAKGNYSFPSMPPDAKQFAPPKANSTPLPLHYPIREVCYCNKKDIGWRWEVHLDTGEVFRIDGNADLEKRAMASPP